MLKSVNAPPSNQSYPLPWSMPTKDAVRGPAEPYRDERLMRIDDPRSLLGRWLREFRDDATGGASPPPMH